MEGEVTLEADERALADRVAERRDEIVALASELIALDTTTRARPSDRARQEAELQEALADATARRRRRGRRLGAERRGRSRASADPGGGIGFEGRPQLAARFRGSGGGGSLLLNGHIDVVPADPDAVPPTGRGRQPDSAAAPAT